MDSFTTPISRKSAPVFQPSAASEAVAAIERAVDAQKDSWEGPPQLPEPPVVRRVPFAPARAAAPPGMFDVQPLPFSLPDDADAPPPIRAVQIDPELAEMAAEFPGADVGHLGEDDEEGRDMDDYVDESPRYTPKPQFLEEDEPEPYYG